MYKMHSFNIFISTMFVAHVQEKVHKEEHLCTTDTVRAKVEKGTKRNFFVFFLPLLLMSFA